MFTTASPCPKAKALAGTMMCPCHGMHTRLQQERTAPKYRRPRSGDRPVQTRVRIVIGPNERESIRSSFSAGESMTALARRYHTRQATIRGIVADLIPTKETLAESEMGTRLRAEYMEGATIRQLSRRYHLKEQRISEVIGDAVRRQRRLTESEKADILSSRQGGESVSAIARRYGVDRWTIYGALGKKRIAA